MRDQTGWEENRGPWKVWTGELPTRPWILTDRASSVHASILSAPLEKRNPPQGSHVPGVIHTLTFSNSTR